MIFLNEAMPYLEEISTLYITPTSSTLDILNCPTLEARVSILKLFCIDACEKA